VVKKAGDKEPVASSEVDPGQTIEFTILPDDVEKMTGWDALFPEQSSLDSGARFRRPGAPLNE